MEIISADFNKTQRLCLKSVNKKVNSFALKYDGKNQYIISNTCYKPQTCNILENYEFAKAVFKRNIKQGTGIFGNNFNIEELMQNDKIRRNVVRFLSEYAKEEIEKIDKKKMPTSEELNQREVLEEVSNFFGEFLDVWPESELSNDNYYEIYQKQVAFGGSLSQADEKKCKNIVHLFSLVCSGISASWGEGAIAGADTPYIRVAQLLMFMILKTKMGVPPIPSVEYITKEMYSGYVLGVKGAEFVISLLGIGGHVVSVASGTSFETGGTSDKAITAGVGSVNGTLSGLITEKMGRGYIKRVKENKMTFKEQSQDLLIYLGQMKIFETPKMVGEVGNGLSEAKNAELIQNAILNMPKKTLKNINLVMNLLKDTSDNVLRLFVFNCGRKIYANKDTIKTADEETYMKILKESLEETIFQSIFEAIGNELVLESIKQTSQNKVTTLKQALKDCPEIYKTFINKEHEFFENLDINIMNSNDFAKQFEDPQFFKNLRIFIEQSTRDIINEYRAKKNEEQKIKK